MRRLSKHGFTLIELLVVLAVISILMTMVPRGIRRSRENAKRAQAMTEMQSIETAVTAYFNEYGKLPVADDQQGVADPVFDLGSYGSAEAFSRGVISCLTTEDNTLNPRELQFLEPQFSSSSATNEVGSFLDPWGYQYLLVLDTDYDRTISLLGDTINKRTALVSVGFYEASGGSETNGVVFSWK